MSLSPIIHENISKVYNMILPSPLHFSQPFSYLCPHLLLIRRINYAGL